MGTQEPSCTLLVIVVVFYFISTLLLIALFHLYTCGVSMKKFPPSFETAKEMWEHVEDLPGGPEWHAEEVILPEVPDEPQVFSTGTLWSA
jgi:hypothetical protein